MRWLRLLYKLTREPPGKITRMPLTHQIISHKESKVKALKRCGRLSEKFRRKIPVKFSKKAKTAIAYGGLIVYN